MPTPSDYTRKVQGTILRCTRGANPSFDIGEIIDFNNLGSPRNDIDIGSWLDKSIKTRAGRRKLSDATFDVLLNPDDDSQRQLMAMKGTDEVATYELIYPEGTLKNRTFTALVAQFGDDGKDDGVYMGHITLSPLSSPALS